VCIRPYNLIFIVDQTNSIKIEKYKKLVPVMTSLLSGMDIKKGGVQASMIGLGHGDAYVLVNFQNSLSTDKKKFIEYVKNSPFQGGYTDLPAAANRAIDLMKGLPSHRKQYRTYVFVFTDGMPEVATISIAQMRKKTRNAFHHLRTSFNNLYFQGIALGNKYYSTYANRAILQFISNPQPVITMSKIKPYNPFMKSLMTKVCQNSGELAANSQSQNEALGEMAEY
jgi:Mg-chelatase subunit ChlD